MKTDKPLIPTSVLSSMGIVLLILNAVWLWGNGVFSERTIDLRWCPPHFFVVPASLILMSLFGLRRLQNTKMFYLVCLGLLAAGVASAEEGRLRMITPNHPVTDADVHETLRLSSQGGHNRYPHLVRCFAVMEYRYTGGRYEEENIRFRLHRPRTMQPGQKYPMIVWLHGRGDADDENERQLTHVQSMIDLLAGKKAEDFFVLAVSCPEDNRHWMRSTVADAKGDAPITVTSEIMEAIIAEYPIDPNKIGVFGISSGANCAWEYVRRNPNRLAAMVACSGEPPSDVLPDDFLNTAVWSFANRFDLSVPYADTQQFIDAINADGGNAYQTVYDASGHDSWTHAMRRDKAIHWLLLQSRDRPGPPPGVVCRPLSVRNQLVMFALPTLLILTVAILGRKKRKQAEKTNAS